MGNRLVRIVKRLPKYIQVKYSSIYFKFRRFTMNPPVTYLHNLMLAEKFKHVDGAIIECGTWRGGMIAGIGQLFNQPNREYYLFDSFEGLPEPTKEDGDRAFEWQADTTSDEYFDNCSAEMSFAEEATKLAGMKNVNIIKGWFNETLPNYDKNKKIAILRLDGDWYDSTMQCLENLYDSVVIGGLIIIDDYYAWDGCTRAIHDFLSQNGIADRICSFNNDVCYIVKTGKVYKEGEQ